jgi:tetratricopeptide (TPR) repeat protein
MPKKRKYYAEADSKPPMRGGAAKKQLRPLFFIIFLRRFYKPLTAILSLIVFFIVYNTYIVDRSMVNIQFALEKTAKAQTLDDVQGLDMILGTVILKEMAAQKIDSENIINLDFATNITADAQILNQVKDARLMLTEVVKKKKRNRNFLLAGLDTINEKIMNTGAGIANIISKTAARQLVVIEPDEKAIQNARDIEKNGRLDEAIKAYEDALKPVPQYQGLEKVHLGYLYQRTGNIGKAMVLYEGILKDSTDARACEFAARLLDNLKDLKPLTERKKMLQQEISVEADPEKLQDLYYQLGNATALLGDFVTSEDAYAKAVAINPKNEIGQRAAFSLGFSYKAQAKYEDSEKVFRQLSETFPQGKFTADASYWTADSLVKQGKYEEGFSEFQKVSDNFKDKPIGSTAMFRSGYTALYDLKDSNRAQTIFEKLKTEFSDSGIAQRETEDAGSDLGSVYRAAGFKLMLELKLEEAMAQFNQAIKLNPRDVHSYGGLGSAEGFMNQWDEAIRDAKKAVALAPGDSYGNANLAFMYLLQNDTVAALKYYEKTVSINPRYSEAQYNLGWLYQSQGQMEKAMDAYKTAIKYNPRLAMAHNNLGYCYWRFDKTDAAASEFLLAVQLDKNLAEAHYNLGIVQFLQGRLKQAEAQMEKVLELTTDLPNARVTLEAIRKKIQEQQK